MILLVQVHGPLSTIMKPEKLYNLEVLTHATHNATHTYKSNVNEL